MFYKCLHGFSCGVEADVCMFSTSQCTLISSGAIITLLLGAKTELTKAMKSSMNYNSPQFLCCENYKMGCFFCEYNKKGSIWSKPPNVAAMFQNQYLKYSRSWHEGFHRNRQKLRLCKPFEHFFHVFDIKPQLVFSLSRLVRPMFGLFWHFVALVEQYIVLVTILLATSDTFVQLLWAEVKPHLMPVASKFQLLDCLTQQQASGQNQLLRIWHTNWLKQTSNNRVEGNNNKNKSFIIQLVMT